MSDKIYLTIYRGGHVCLIALDLRAADGVVAVDWSEIGFTRAEIEQALRDVADQHDDGWLYVAGLGGEADAEAALDLALAFAEDVRDALGEM